MSKVYLLIRVIKMSSSRDIETVVAVAESKRTAEKWKEERTKEEMDAQGNLKSTYYYFQEIPLYR